MSGEDALLYAFQEAMHIIEHPKPKPKPKPRVPSGDRDPLKPHVHVVKSAEFRYVIKTRPSRCLHYAARIVDEERSHWTLTCGGIYEIPLAQFGGPEDCDDDLVHAVAMSFLDDYQQREIVRVALRREADRVVFSFEEK